MIATSRATWFGPKLLRIPKWDVKLSVFRKKAIVHSYLILYSFGPDSMACDLSKADAGLLWRDPYIEELISKALEQNHEQFNNISVSNNHFHHSN